MFQGFSEISKLSTTSSFMKQAPVCSQRHTDLHTDPKTEEQRHEDFLDEVQIPEKCIPSPSPFQKASCPKETAAACAPSCAEPSVAAAGPKVWPALPTPLTSAVGPSLMCGGCVRCFLFGAKRCHQAHQHNVHVPLRRCFWCLKWQPP